MISPDGNDQQYDGIVHDPSVPDYSLMPPLGVVLRPEVRTFLVNQYGEPVVQDWERRSVEFLARKNEPVAAVAAERLSDEEEVELLRALGYDV